MTSVRRLRAVGAFLALAAVCATAYLWGEPANKSLEKWRFNGRRNSLDKAEENFAEDLANSKFAKGGLLTYKTTTGDLLFALQLKPKLDKAADRPRDILFMNDTSASQVKGPLAAARAITEETINSLKPDDRVSIWTVNTPQFTKDLTRGFVAPGSPQVKDALAVLKQEYPAGDTDLKDGLKRATDAFEPNKDRQLVLVFLGDGMSVHNPISDVERGRLTEDLVKKNITVFPVPLGPRLEPKNLHGLATGTGGTVVRMGTNEKGADVAKNLIVALAVPVLYPSRFELGKEVTEAFPTTLPPLRADAPTLVVGRLKAADKISYTLDGTVAGQDVHLGDSQAITETETDNFFLVSIVEQWKHARERPALTRADRALAFASEQVNLARAEYLAQAEWALGQNQFEAARDLFQQTKDLDPTDVEAEAGLKLVKKLQAELLKKKQLKGLKAGVDKNVPLQVAQAGPEPVGAGAVAGNAPPKEDLLQEQLQRRAVEEQRLKQIVDDARRQARKLLQTDPEASQDLLRRTLGSVRDNPDLGDAVRLQLETNLTASLKNARDQGILILQERDVQLRRLADAQRRNDLDRIREGEEARTSRRMQAFGVLMAQARYEDAYLQALAIEQDAINNARPVPPAATAGYDIGLYANQLSQLNELKRTREERFLLTMMQVERSHIPFPDEPPIQFPPAATWRELTRLRKERYESSGFVEDDPETLRRVKKLQSLLSRPVTFEKGLDPNTKLKDALDFIADRYEVTIVVDTAAFKAVNADVNLDDKEVRLPRMVGVSLGTVLRLLTAQVDGTYLIRRDYIEITTGEQAVSEKVIRVYPVADLVTPIPNSFNARAVGSVLSILGTSPGLGLQLGGPQALGGIGQALGAGAAAFGLGGGLGGFGGGLGGLGGGLGGLGGGLGGLGGAGQGGGGLAGGLGFQGGMNNQGVGGGALGFGGGQLGQLGNLGGQFGIQGGDQSIILIRLIRDVIGNPKKDWAPLTGFNRPQGGAGVNPAGAMGDDVEVEDTPDKWNSLGYYPPARALVVKGSSRVHTNLGGPLVGVRPGPPGMGALERRGRDDVAVFGPGGKKDKNLDAKPQEQLAANAPKGGLKNDAKKGDAGNKPATVVAANKNPGKPLADLDATKIWQDALEKGVKDPGLIIAVADYLMEHEKFNHVAEFLKANLRQGIVARPWVYESLAIALEASKASTAEIERARVSAIDLEPQDAQSYVHASKAMADQGRWDRAVAFCRQAALLEPNSSYPYEEALLYADTAKDTEGMKWAAGNLLRQDWPTENQEIHLKASGRLNDLAKKLSAAEAEQLLKAVTQLGERDFVIKLEWQGDADLEMDVTEPIGTTCSFTRRQTPGGGILLGDAMLEAARQTNNDALSKPFRQTYVAAKAFSGEYRVTLRRIWGRPLGGKATLDIIQHQGTPNESHKRQTVAFDRSHTLTLALDDGRRTSPEYVPPPSSQRSKKKPMLPTSKETLAKLRKIADPEYREKEVHLGGGLASLGIREESRSPHKQETADLMVYQNRVASTVGNAIDFTSETTVSSDQRVQVRLSPVFRTVNRSQSLPAISNPMIPGGFDSSDTN